MVIKIENYETHKSDISADSFNFQHNPRTFDDQITPFLDEQSFAYSFTFYGTTSQLKATRPIVLSGHFDGSVKDSNYRSLSAHASDGKLKKLYWSSDKFYIGFFRNCKKTHSGGRTNFIDYVAQFISIFGILFDDTEKSGGSGAADTNDGNVFTPIEKITGSVTSGQTVVVEDADGNGFTLTAGSTGTLTVRLVYLEDIGDDNNFTAYIRADIGGTEQSIKKSNSGKSMVIGINPGDSLSDTFSGATITNITPTFFFRDGWSAE